MTQMKYRFFLLPLFLLMACAGAFAQANSDVTGIVTDQTGAAVQDAKIVLTDPATGITKSTMSGATGLYDIPGLNAAKYNLKVAAKGFESYIQNGHRCRHLPDVPCRCQADHRHRSADQSRCEADALAVQGDSNVVSTLINEQQITELATNGRNVIGLAALGLGVSGNLPDMETYRSR